MDDLATSSLRKRIQNRLNSVKDIVPSLKSIPFDKEESSSEESDIDDNLTLEECAKFINERKKHKENSFTNLTEQKTLKQKNINLKDVISQKLEDKKEKGNLDQNISTCDSLTEFRNNDNVQPVPILVPNVESNHSEQNNNDNPVKKKKMTDEGKKLAKQQKEKEKLEKRKERERLRMEKAMEKEMQKAIKKVHTLNNRNERKDECMERILAVIDPCLIQEKGGADILKALQDLNVRYEMKELPVTSCIGWMRESVDYSLKGQSEISKSSRYVEEEHVIYKMSAAEVAARINAELKELNDEETLNDLMLKLKRAYKKKIITLVVTGMNAYHRFVKTKENQRFRDQALGVEPNAKKRKKTNDVPLLTKEDVEDAFVALQCTQNVFVRFCEGMEQFSMFIVSFTKSIAEAPFKKSDETSLRFHSSTASGKSSVKIARDGHGILEVWNQQLQQFYGVRHDTSVAITQVYPTPLSLMKAYKNAPDNEGPKLLQDIEIRRGIGVLQTQRRVGPELSKRIHKLFTSRDGNEILAR